jgi:isopentenyl diphosphate isomerase/L-lactate dehydrogenase-like FMN-dependent dehydrogenase
MPDTLTIIRDVVQMTDNAVAVQAEMTKEELVQEMIRIGSIGHPALTYQIDMKHRGQRHRRQQG